MKIGLISMPLMGHLNPMIAVERKLQSRGNDVVFIGIPDTEPAVLAAGVSFLPYCEREYPLGSMARILGPAATMRGLALAEFEYRDLIPGLTQAAFEHLPEKLADEGIHEVAQRIDGNVHFRALAALGSVIAGTGAGLRCGLQSPAVKADGFTSTTVTRSVELSYS